MVLQCGLTGKEPTREMDAIRMRADAGNGTRAESQPESLVPRPARRSRADSSRKEDQVMATKRPRGVSVPRPFYSSLTEWQEAMQRLDDAEKAQRARAAAKKPPPAQCAWCDAEATPGVGVAGYPACAPHVREISVELQTNVGKILTPTREEKAARQERFRKWMQVEQDWQSQQKWTGP
jgi:hypothetical protein